MAGGFSCDHRDHPLCSYCTGHAAWHSEDDGKWYCPQHLHYAQLKALLREETNMALWEIQVRQHHRYIINALTEDEARRLAREGTTTDDACLFHEWGVLSTEAKLMMPTQRTLQKEPA